MRGFFLYQFFFFGTGIEGGSLAGKLSSKASSKSSSVCLGPSFLVGVGLSVTGFFSGSVITCLLIFAGGIGVTTQYKLKLG